MITKQVLKDKISNVVRQLNELHRQLEIDDESVPVADGRQKLKKGRKDKYRLAITTKKAS